MKKEVERIKKLVGIDHNRWEQPCTCDKCKNMCKVSCIGTPKDIEAIIDAGYADRLKETMWMVGYLAVKEKPIAMIQPTEKDGWYVVFSSGLTGTGNKHIGDMVRTVIDF